MFLPLRQVHLHCLLKREAKVGKCFQVWYGLRVERSELLAPVHSVSRVNREDKEALLVRFKYGLLLAGQLIVVGVVVLLARFRLR